MDDVRVYAYGYAWREMFVADGEAGGWDFAREAGRHGWEEAEDFFEDGLEVW